MKRLFKSSFLGYNRKQVNAYVLSLRKDYENELTKKKDRMFELTRQNRDYRDRLRELEEQLSQYGEQERLISKAMLKAEESAQEIIRESHHKIELERYKLNQAKDKWKNREKEIMKQLLAFQNEAYSLMESFQSEISYLTSRELGQREEDNQNQKGKPALDREYIDDKKQESKKANIEKIDTGRKLDGRGLAGDRLGNKSPGSKKIGNKKHRGEEIMDEMLNIGSV